MFHEIAWWTLNCGGYCICSCATWDACAHEMNKREEEESVHFVVFGYSRLCLWYAEWG